MDSTQDKTGSTIWLTYGWFDGWMEAVVSWRYFYGVLEENWWFI